MRVEDGKLVSERPILQDSSVSDVHYRSDVGVIIGRLNAFEAKESGDGSAARRGRRRSTSSRTRCGRRWSRAASSAAPT